MVLDIHRFSKCLFAYLYKHYKLTESSELSAGLPSPSDFVMPKDFIQSIGECQILVNRILRPYFKPVFDRVCNWACRSERTFLEFVNRRCQRLPIDHTPLLFLTICAVVLELNLYCFQRDCFRFAGFAPTCLVDILLSSDDIRESIINDTSAFVSFGEKKIDGVKALQEYCEILLAEVEQNPDFIPPIIEEAGRNFLRVKDKPMGEKVVKKSGSMSVLRELGEGENDPLLGAGRSLTPEGCKFCREKDCSIYLKEFEANYYLTFLS